MDTRRNAGGPPRGLEERLFEARTLMISGEINQKLAESISLRLLALSAASSAPINLFINSHGGHVEAGDTIHDMIRFVAPRVRIIGTGWVASAGALIYVAAPVEDRYSLPNTRFLLHQPMGAMRGTEADIAIEAEQIVSMRSRLNRIFAEQTGQKLAKIQKDTDRNFWLTASEAIKYGLVGKIVGSAAEID
jgi:ATP-dependent Clp protease protease subunit